MPFAGVFSRITRWIWLLPFAQNFLAVILVFRVLRLGEVMSWAELRETVPH